MSEPIISVDRLGFRYPDGTQALEGISLEIRPQEMVGLIGTNGSGKTTLSKCLNGILKATSGKVVVDQITVDANLRSSKLISSIGYVFQNPDHQLFNNKIYDEIAYAPKNLKLSADEVDRRVREAAQIAGISEDLFDEHPFFQTKGIRQRIAIASILSLRPKVIIVDEPTTGQDYRQSREVMEFLRDLNANGHTIIVITHDMDIVAEYTDRVIAMTHGKIILDGPTRDVLSATDVIAEADLLPPLVTRLGQRLPGARFSGRALFPDELVAEWQGESVGANR
ncbi:ATP-binding cassette domain-containing protein [Propionimicrobium sp. PCR01-08-3]|uniref:energy-coupling factor ABC transporter ATP-binding protein n=1 Tax=Propionimicrobium sp. PCR01-08-3 TaxID=3052086 RepID=UPI00255CFAE4|nr:ATP-binding cassette domain-containing protein [Propionimicrobium sp. PCR01-08-3]WIY82531.1 ATP-binding cassette domain-containing protein [Propionimicrobium sp. PCR01-08-3]